MEFDPQALGLEPTPEQLRKKKLTAVIVAAVAVVGLLFAGVSRRWTAADYVDAGFGPRGWSCEDKCGPELSGSRSNQVLVDFVKEARRMGVPVKEPSGLFPLMGWATLLFIVLGVGFLSWAAIAALKGPVPTRPVPPTALALLSLFGAIICGCVFIALNPLRDKGVSAVGVDLAFWVFGVSVVAGITAAQMLAKFKKVDPVDYTV